MYRLYNYFNNQSYFTNDMVQHSGIRGVLLTGGDDLGTITFRDTIIWSLGMPNQIFGMLDGNMYVSSQYEEFDLNSIFKLKLIRPYSYTNKDYQIIL